MEIWILSVMACVRNSGVSVRRELTVLIINNKITSQGTVNELTIPHRKRGSNYFSRKTNQVRHSWVRGFPMKCRWVSMWQMCSWWGENFITLFSVDQPCLLSYVILKVKGKIKTVRLVKHQYKADLVLSCISVFTSVSGMTSFHVRPSSLEYSTLRPGSVALTCNLQTASQTTLQARNIQTKKGGGVRRVNLS